MANDNVSLPLGPSSALVESQLVPIAQAIAIMPPAAPFVVPSAGASVSTLPGMGAGGAATGSMGSDTGSMTSDASAEQAGQAPSGGKILGLPALVFWVLVALLIGYVFIWQVHFK